MRRSLGLFLLALFLGVSMQNCAHPRSGVPAQRGRASWYGATHQGRRTASGEKFDMNADTAAHPTLPMNSLVRVTSLSSGKSVSVRINDRGPFSGGRLIDVSRSAAQKLGFIEKGLDEVEIEVLSTPGK